MAAPDILWKNGRFGHTSRRDTWWLEPLLVFLGLGRQFVSVSGIILGFLVYDAVKGCLFDGHFGIGVGSLVLSINVVLLAGYLFACHAFRHLIGGVFDQLTRHPVRHKLYD